MISLIEIGLKPYKETLAYQEKLREKRLAGKISDTVIFCEHYPVFTIGKRDSSSDWLSDFGTIADEGIEIVKTDRGGRITYHGPGQLVVYFIFNINNRGAGIKEFVHKIEDVCITMLKNFGINAVRSAEYPGLWVATPFSHNPPRPTFRKGRKKEIMKKIAALGFHVSKGVTMHGIAINVNPDMSHYKHIIPCGIKERGITSMKELIGKPPKMDEIVQALKSELSNFFH